MSLQFCLLQISLASYSPALCIISFTRGTHNKYRSLHGEQNTQCCSSESNLAHGSGLLFIKTPSRLLFILGIEYAWNVFPSTPTSSAILCLCNFAILAGVWLGYPEGADAEKARPYLTASKSASAIA